MRSDGAVLPDLAETAVLHRLGLVRTDDLPMLAARWLGSEVVDTESARLLAAHDPQDPWSLERLLADTISEAQVAVPSDDATVQRIAVDWVASTWRGDTRWAVKTLARLGEAKPDLDLGAFIGFDDEWGSDWGRSEQQIQAEAVQEFDRLLRESGNA